MFGEGFKNNGIGKYDKRKLPKAKFNIINYSALNFF